MGDFGPCPANGFERDDAGKDWSYKVKYCDITHVEGMTVSHDLFQAYKIKTQINKSVMPELSQNFEFTINSAFHVQVDRPPVIQCTNIY